MRKMVIVLSLLSNFLYADPAEQHVKAIQEELLQIISFAQEQQQNCYQEYEILQRDTNGAEDLWMETLLDDEKEFNSIETKAKELWQALENRNTVWWVNTKLQLLRNHIYTYADAKELCSAGIKRRSKDLWALSKELLSDTSSLLIKITGTITAIKTMYEIAPCAISYFCAYIGQK